MRSGLEPGTGGDSGIPAAHGARGWGWGSGSAALLECLLDRNGPGHGSVFREAGQSGSAGGELMRQSVDAGAGERFLL